MSQDRNPLLRLASAPPTPASVGAAEANGRPTAAASTTGVVQVAASISADANAGRTYEVGFDDKGRMTLPPAPDLDDLDGHCRWLTAAFALDPRRPIVNGRRAGLSGPKGHAVLRRLDAPELRFEPITRLNTPGKLIEDLSSQMVPSDGAVPALKADHCRLIAHVVRMLLGASAGITAEQETAQIIGAFLQSAEDVTGPYTCFGTSRQRYEAAVALRRENERDPRLSGPHRYFRDSRNGQLVIRVSDLQELARRIVGGSLERGWLDGRIDDLGWERRMLDGHELPGTAGRTGPHARCAIYRGYLPDHDDDGPVTT